jgi:tRNA(Ile)-lysidine synthase
VVQGLQDCSLFQSIITKHLDPFLDFSKKQILDYAEANNIQYLDDPTNTETDFLRNWIRNDWLPALDKKHRGGVRQLALSIDRILEGHDDLSKNIEFDGEKVTLSRLWFFGLSAKDQLKILSQSLQYFESIEFTVGNLQEINKRLDKNQKEHIFTELGLNWVFDAQQIVIRFVGNK